MLSVMSMTALAIGATGIHTGMAAMDTAAADVADTSTSGLPFPDAAVAATTQAAAAQTTPTGAAGVTGPPDIAAALTGVILAQHAITANTTVVRHAAAAYQATLDLVS